MYVYICTQTLHNLSKLGVGVRYTDTMDLLIQRTPCHYQHCKVHLYEQIVCGSSFCIRRKFYIQKFHSSICMFIA